MFIYSAAVLLIILIVVVVIAIVLYKKKKEVLPEVIRAPIAVIDRRISNMYMHNEPPPYNLEQPADRGKSVIMDGVSYMLTVQKNFTMLPCYLISNHR